MRLHPLRALLILASVGLLAALAWPHGSVRVQDLVSPDPDVALSAIQAFHSLSAAGEDVVSELVRGLGDPDPRVRARCVRMLAALNANEHADTVAALLADPDAYVRIQVGLALRSLRDYEDPSPLLKAFANRAEWESIRVDVASSLTERRTAAARTVFASVARDRSEPETVRIVALRGLGALRTDRELLLKVASSTSEPNRVRRVAMLALGQQSASDYLRKVASSPTAEEHLRGDAAVALARSGAPGTRELYRSLLQDRRTPLYVRLQATRGVWLTDDAVGRCEPLVREGLASADPEARRCAAFLAREATVVEVCPELTATLAREAEGPTRAALEEALYRLEPEALADVDPDQLLVEP